MKIGPRVGINRLFVFFVLCQEARPLSQLSQSDTELVRCRVKRKGGYGLALFSIT